MSQINVPQDEIKIKAKSDVQDVLKIVRDVARETTGAEIDTNAPLMSAGLDSIAVVELVNTLSKRFGIEIQQTALFDHPTLDSLATFLSSELTSNEATSTRSREEVSTASQEEETRKYLFINPKAEQGIFVWR